MFRFVLQHFILSGRPFGQQLPLQEALHWDLEEAMGQQGEYDNRHQTDEEHCVWPKGHLPAHFQEVGQQLLDRKAPEVYTIGNVAFGEQICKNRLFT